MEWDGRKGGLGPSPMCAYTQALCELHWALCCNGAVCSWACRLLPPPQAFGPQACGQEPVALWHVYHNASTPLRK